MIHQEVSFATSADNLYSAFTDAKVHAAFTGGKSEIADAEGGAFSLHDGQIVGRQIELVPGKRVVQAWRVAGWPEGLFTIVRIELESKGGETKLTLDHAGVPDEMVEHIAGGWHARYWEPLQKHFA